MCPCMSRLVSGQQRPRQVGTIFSIMDTWPKSGGCHQVKFCSLEVAPGGFPWIIEKAALHAFFGAAFKGWIEF